MSFFYILPTFIVPLNFCSRTLVLSSFVAPNIHLNILISTIFLRFLHSAPYIMVDLRRLVKFKNSLDIIHPTHPPTHPPLYPKKISENFKIINHEYLYIGLYRDVWIAAIASSGTSLATLMAVMCNTSQCELRSLRVNAGMLNVIRIVTYYTLPPLESPDSFWIAMAFSR